MSAFNFADSYKAAGLTPGPEIIRLRQEPFDRVSKDLPAERVIDLVRMYFGLPVPAGAQWFRDEFASTDPSFTLLDNARETAVLSACILGAQIDQGRVAAPLAVVTAAAASNRQPVVQPRLIESAREFLHTAAIAARKHTLVKATLASSDVEQAADALAGSGDWPKAAALFKQLAVEGRTRREQLSKQIAVAEEEIRDLREEVDCLWWYIGGWSRILERPFAELPSGLAAAMAGFDLAALTKGSVGPAAAPAILRRVLATVKREETAKPTISEAVDAMPSESLSGIQRSKQLPGVADICPVSFAFAQAAEIGASPAWHEPFKRQSHLNASTAFEPLELSMQIFREQLLLRHLGSGT